jgi:hypothetical protein
MVNVSTAVPTYVAAVCRAVLEANRMGTLAAVRAVALAETHVSECCGVRTAGDRVCGSRRMTAGRRCGASTGP